MRKIVPLVLIVIAATAAAADDGWHVLDDQWLACRKSATQDKLSDFRDSGDKDAFTNYATAALAIGECRFLPKGVTVHVDDVSVWSGLACLRERGTTECLWANRMAVKKATD